EVAGSIPGEGAAGAIRTMRTRCQSHNQYPRIGITEAGDGLAPVVPLTIGAALFAGYLLAILHQAWTPRAANDFAIQDGQPGHFAITSHRGAKLPPREPAGCRALPGKDGLIPGAEGLAIAFRIVASRLLPQPSLVQQLGTQLTHGSVVVNFNVAEE